VIVFTTMAALTAVLSADRGISVEVALAATRQSSVFSVRRAVRPQLDLRHGFRTLNILVVPVWSRTSAARSG